MKEIVFGKPSGEKSPTKKAAARRKAANFYSALE
jgi:hypothetical protein